MWVTNRHLPQYLPSLLAGPTFYIKKKNMLSVYSSKRVLPIVSMVAVKFHGYSDDADRIGNAFFKKYDTNNDRMFDRDEYKTVNAQFPSEVRITPGLPTNQQMQDWSGFDHADTNRDGFIDREEMGNMVHRTQSASKWVFGAAVVLFLLSMALVYMAYRWHRKKRAAGHSSASSSSSSSSSSSASSSASTRSSTSSKRSQPRGAQWSAASWNATRAAVTQPWRNGS